MRLIDGDALEREISVLHSMTDDYGIQTGYVICMRSIENAPTIEPRTKGMWIEHNPHKWGLGIVFECSECGEKIDCEPSNFCPNCGAEMREPEDIPMEYFESGGR